MHLISYDETIWYVTIPNTKSASYLSNYNSYQEALRARDKALPAHRPKLIGLKRIRGEDIAGTVFGHRHGVDIEVGGLASANEHAISLISANTLQIESFVPEINVSLLELVQRRGYP